MKERIIAILANSNSIHTQRWVNELVKRQYKIHLISQSAGCNNLPSHIDLHYLPFHCNIGYFFNVPFLKMLLRKIKPDLLHVHYASGYGTLGRLCGFHPYMLSVWGSDVFDFPYQSSIKMSLIQKNLRAADLIASTSNAMAKQTHKICEGLSKIHITPFGIDIHSFKPQGDANQQKIKTITVGTVKTLDFIYGVDILLKGFAEARKAILSVDKKIASMLRLLIVGGGKEKDYLVNLANELGIMNVTEFAGAVPHSSVPDFLNNINVYVAASRYESFGVAVLEASACALPVIVTNVGGLPEVVEDGVTGLVIPKDDHIALAKAIETLIMDESLRRTMGHAGLKRVVDNYTWENSVSIMEEVYKKII